jgi:hypothetical protein
VTREMRDLVRSNVVLQKARGKTSRGGHSPGVDEEIQIARAAGLPVYIFGSVGGRSSELSAAMTPAERVAFSGLSESASEELATSLDYSRIAKLILATDLFPFWPSGRTVTPLFTAFSSASF